MGKKGKEERGVEVSRCRGVEVKRVSGKSDAKMKLLVE
jgi:hypothetical protein